MVTLWKHRRNTTEQHTAVHSDSVPTMSLCWGWPPKKKGGDGHRVPSVLSHARGTGATHCVNILQSQHSGTVFWNWTHNYQHSNTGQNELQHGGTESSPPRVRWVFHLHYTQEASEALRGQADYYSVIQMVSSQLGLKLSAVLLSLDHLIQTHWVLKQERMYMSVMLGNMGCAWPMSMSPAAMNSGSHIQLSWSFLRLQKTVWASKYSVGQRWLVVYPQNNSPLLPD